MMKRIAIMAAACTATLVVIVAWNMKTDGHAYRAERKFAYWHSPVLTNEFGGVRQSEYSGPAAEEIVAPLLAGRDGGFLTA